MVLGDSKSQVALQCKEKAKVAIGLGKVPLCQAKVAIPPPPISQVYTPVSHTPKMGFKLRRIQRKGGRGTKGVVPSAATPVMPFFQRLRQRMKWWRLHAPPPVLKLIQHGVPSQWPLSTPSLHLRPCHRSCADQTAALLILEEYKAVGAVKEVYLQGTQFLLLWFVIRKGE